MTKRVCGLRKAGLILLGMALTVFPLKAGDTTPVFFQDLKRGGQKTVVFYGTSLTHSGSWTRATREWFEAKYPGQVTCVNSGGPGQTSDWGVKNLSDKVLSHNPDLVFVEFSYNDAHAKFHIPVEQGFKNLEEIVSRIREKNPQSLVILQTMNSPWDAPGKPSATDRPRLEEFNDNYRLYAGANHLPLFDHYVSWKALEKEDPEKFRAYIPDGSHPTSEAGLVVVWPTIQRWLEEQARLAK